jgi:hypothetical protein
MSGTLRADSEEGYGSVFTLEVPLPYSQQDDVMASDHPQSSILGKWLGGVAGGR